MTAALADFSDALRYPGRPPPPGLRAWNGADVGRRFDVHRNTFVATLVQALGETLPVCRQALGAGTFDALARSFVLQHPPRSPVLAEWGDDFAPWIASLPQAAPWPWLPALARLERARVQAFHAADAPSLDAVALAPRLADVSALPASQLHLHPSCRVVLAEWGVVSLWAAHQGDAAAEELSVFERREAALVLRDDTPAGGGEVAVLPLPPAAAAFCAALAQAHTLAEAVTLAAADPEPAGLDLANTLALLIRHGAIAGWHALGDDA